MSRGKERGEGLRGRAERKRQRTGIRLQLGTRRGEQTERGEVRALRGPVSGPTCVSGPGAATAPRTRPGPRGPPAPPPSWGRGERRAASSSPPPPAFLLLLFSPPPVLPLPLPLLPRSAGRGCAAGCRGRCRLPAGPTAPLRPCREGPARPSPVPAPASAPNNSSFPSPAREKVMMALGTLLRKPPLPPGSCRSFWGWLNAVFNK